VNRRCHASVAGFTLLELVVVLLLLALMTSMALPRMQRWHDAVQARAQGAAVLDQLRAAAFAAGARRMRLALTASSLADAVPAAESQLLHLSLPPGWVATRVEEAAFLANGLCEPGALELRSDRGVDLRLRISGPRCGVSIEAMESAG
jgi:prepilin-type N-terminal cleavage/methylation domain-containing protein